MRTEMLSTLLTQMTKSGHVEVQGNEHTTMHCTEMEGIVALLVTCTVDSASKWGHWVLGGVGCYINTDFDLDTRISRTC